MIARLDFKSGQYKNMFSFSENGKTKTFSISPCNFKKTWDACVSIMEQNNIDIDTLLYVVDKKRASWLYRVGTGGTTGADSYVFYFGNAGDKIAAEDAIKKANNILRHMDKPLELLKDFIEYSIE